MITIINQNFSTFFASPIPYSFFEAGPATVVAAVVEMLAVVRRGTCGINGFIVRWTVLTKTAMGFLVILVASADGIIFNRPTEVCSKFWAFEA